MTKMPYFTQGEKEAGKTPSFQSQLLSSHRGLRSQWLAQPSGKLTAERTENNSLGKLARKTQKTSRPLGPKREREYNC